MAALRNTADLGLTPDYTGKVRLFPITADGATFVEWTSRYESADEGAVGELCNPIYQALLSALRTHFDE